MKGIIDDFGNENIQKKAQSAYNGKCEVAYNNLII